MKKYIDLEEFKQKHTCFGYVNGIKEEELDKMAVEGILIPSSSAAALSDALDSAREVSNSINKIAEEFAVALSNKAGEEGHLSYPYIWLTFEDHNGCYDECFEDVNEIMWAVETMWERNVLDETDERSELFYVVSDKEKYRISFAWRTLKQNIKPDTKLIEVCNREEVSRGVYASLGDYKMSNNALLLGILNQIECTGKYDTLLRADDGSEVFLMVRREE